MRQQRDSRIDELREEIHLQVSLHAERELTMTLRLLGEIQEQLRMESRENPEVLNDLRAGFDPGALLEKLRPDLERGGGPQQHLALNRTCEVATVAAIRPSDCGASGRHPPGSPPARGLTSKKIMIS